MDNYDKFEIEQIYEGINAGESLFVQIYSFFGTANLAIMSVALSLRASGLILVALVIGLLGLVDREMKKHLKVHYLRGIQLESQYAREPAKALLHQKALLHLYINNVDYSVQNWVRRHRLPLTIFFVEILMAVISWYFLKWQWF